MRGLRKETQEQISEIRGELRTQTGEFRADVREIRDDIKLLTGKVYEMMGQRPKDAALA